MRSRSDSAFSRRRPERAHGDNDRAATGRLAVLARRTSARTTGQSPATTASARSAYCAPASSALDQPLQVVHADPEVPLLHPAASGVEPALVVGLARHRRAQRLGQGPPLRPRRKEAAADHRVEHPGIARQIAGERGRGGADLDDEASQLRVRLEQREQLHARRQPGKERIERRTAPPRAAPPVPAGRGCRAAGGGRSRRRGPSGARDSFASARCVERPNSRGAGRVSPGAKKPSVSSCTSSSRCAQIALERAPVGAR